MSGIVSRTLWELLDQAMRRSLNPATLVAVPAASCLNLQALCEYIDVKSLINSDVYGGIR